MCGAYSEVRLLIRNTHSISTSSGMRWSARFRSQLSGTPLVGSIVRFFYRAFAGVRYIAPLHTRFLKWLVTSREYTNFTYDLLPRNKQYLAAFVAHIVGRSYEDVLHYMLELELDADVAGVIEAAAASGASHRGTDRDMPFGRRLAWYAVVRALKPKVVVETGVDKGLGACVLTAALRRNAEEGAPGRYIGTDINPEAGFLLRGEYRRFGEIMYGDSITSLEKLDVQIDVFINDSDHSAEYEAGEYAAVRDKLSDSAVILGDNAHVTDRLMAFALETNRSFLFFREEPSNHWYPGAGIGAAFQR